MIDVRRSAFRYELRPRVANSKIRQGALLRFEFPDGACGFADCHPWPELGDPPLNEHLNQLARGGSTALLDQSTLFAYIDANARRAGTSLFGCPIPPSHLSIPTARLVDCGALMDSLVEGKHRGFDIVKVKVGDECDVSWLIPLGLTASSLKLKVRVDVNAMLSATEADRLLEMMRGEVGSLAWVDWLEDPCPFNVEDWRNLRRSYGVRIAFDRVADPSCRDVAEASDVLVYKAAVNRAASYSILASWSKLPVCYTSYLDHPVGQAFAAYSASVNTIGAAAIETCGLLTHQVYEETDFSARVGASGPQFIPPGGTGIGFDDLLDALDWEAL